VTETAAKPCDIDEGAKKTTKKEEEEEEDRGEEGDI
jgi:hypothetical protein